jgi:hypothetical protein
VFSFGKEENIRFILESSKSKRSRPLELELNHEQGIGLLRPSKARGAGILIGAVGSRWIKKDQRSICNLVGDQALYRLAGIVADWEFPSFGCVTGENSVRYQSLLQKHPSSISSLRIRNLAFVSILLLAISASPQTAPKAVLFKMNVRVFNGTNTLSKATNVLAVGGKIVKISLSPIAAPDAATMTTIDGAGLTLMRASSTTMRT